jgi:tetratricopeptide (TPR) repeat protein
MKTKCITITLFLLATALGLAIAQENSINGLLYQAYLSKEVNSALWKQAVNEARKIYDQSPRDKQAGFHLATARFALLSSTMRNQDEDLFDEYYGGTVKLLEELNESDKKWAEPRALLSAVYGLKMSYSPMQGMFLGPKSGNLVEKAKSLDPKSPLAWKVYANSKYFTPEMWGGDLNEAIESYEKCIQLYESNPATLKSNWMYLDALAFQGQAYQKNGDTGKAIASYEKALQAEPEFGWVKFTLLPKAKTKSEAK